jgi:copper(I)-binding protein
MLAVLLLGLASRAVLAGDIAIEDPWIQEAPPTASVMAAYMRITNRSAQAVSLESVNSEDFGAAETHSTHLHHDMAHMEKHRGLRIGAGDTVVLAPGGHHLMLMDRQRPLRDGDAARLSLRFSNGEVIVVSAEVRRRPRP